ncbi:hypothetical protein PVAG01_07346 [Phlyctema vagabunda]|uniref:Zn(2)-C6 fungal-type domain-containing protein n=1 Tax=Phlyctema vagabunda TaxID=108571 RepID=A0ABR4PC48_9HELO
MPQDNSKAVKRRACDECRSRKLACSKEPDGCARCIREQIKCYYSEQKQMGRPRKRQFIEMVGDDVGLEKTLQELDTLPFFADDLGYNEDEFTEPYFTAARMFEPPVYSEVSKDSATSGSDSSLHYIAPSTVKPFQYGQVDFGNINFDSTTENDNDMSSDHIPQVLSTPITSLTEAEPPRTVPCSCLASMYLSLAALQQFPSDINSALYAVRSAADTAQKCIWCPQCGSVVLGDETPPIESFQNTMILGTLLPVIANGYGRLLEMVDIEATAAANRGESKTFNLQRYGGFNNCSISNPTPQRLLKIREDEQMFSNKEMQPDMWRTCVRQMLKIDIYGFESKEEGCEYKGLKNILQEMEDRQRTRHHILDAHRKAGTIDQIYPNLRGGHFHGNRNAPQECLGEKTSTCLQIIQIAKYAIDALVIP